MIITYVDVFSHVLLITLSKGSKPDLAKTCMHRMHEIKKNKKRSPYTADWDFFVSSNRTQYIAVV